MEQEHTMNPMEENKLPTTLNVLTILTFIGCAIGLITSVSTFFSGEKNIAKMEEAYNKMDPNTPQFVKDMVSPEKIELMKLMEANKYPMLIFGLLGVALCLMGALQMRKRKMQGYYLWLIGEILPFITAGIFVGFGMYSGFMGIFGIVVLIIMVLLYTMQRKHLTN
ncbi:MAG: sulfite exporter TauE/SafE family protein [Chitinophagaceae bacterium]|nr:sulfite exporter TauE/SafE family protein [Chitinophagaceae bacterium]